MTETQRPETTNETDRRAAQMAALIGYVLLTGTALSVALVVVGLAWRWIDTGVLGVDYAIPKMNLFEFLLAELREIAAGAARPRLLISLGIVVLLLTPLVRVLASLLFFAFAERNGKYVLFTAFVLAVLTYSLLLQ